MAPLLHSVLAISAAISVANCMPWGGWGHGKSQEWTPTIPFNEIDNTGASPLPTPTSSPKYITLGLGFQNYTCNATAEQSTGSWIQTTVAAGAIADLYDIKDDITQWTGDKFSRHTLEAFELCLEATKCTPSTENGFCDKCHDIAATRFKKHLTGDHFFDQVNKTQTPNFDLFEGGDFLSCKKAGGVKAPADAYDGANKLGAVDWLYLVDNHSGRTHGLSSVYRIQTAGGVAPSSCNQVGGALQVPYAAEYWFFD